MTDKELRKLSRSDLLELLISQTEENQVLKSRVEQMQNQLLDRRIAVDKAGSIAEASLQLNGVFQAAEKAAQQYLENIQRMSEEQDTIGRNIRAKATEEAEAIRADAEKIRQEAESYSREVHEQADAYWKQVIDRAAKLLKDQDALREMVQSAGKGMTE